MMSFSRIPPIKMASATDQLPISLSNCSFAVHALQCKWRDHSVGPNESLIVSIRPFHLPFMINHTPPTLITQELKLNPIHAPSTHAPVTRPTGWTAQLLARSCPRVSNFPQLSKRSHSLALVCTLVPKFVHKLIERFWPARSVWVWLGPRSRAISSLDPMQNGCKDLDRFLAQDRRAKSIRHLPSTRRPAHHYAQN